MLFLLNYLGFIYFLGVGEEEIIKKFSWFVSLSSSQSQKNAIDIWEKEKKNSCYSPIKNLFIAWYYFFSLLIK